MRSLMAVLREKVLPRQESSHSSCSGARRSGMGWANGIGRAGCPATVADTATAARVAVLPAVMQGFMAKIGP